MPRSCRIVLPGFPHHIVQRGNRRQQVFFNDIDKRAYLKLLRTQCSRHAVAVWAYCLMDNHVHVILVPSRAEGLSMALSETHRSYTTMINRRHGWRGYLWQGRFHSSVMGGMHLLRGIRYVERNPVRAGMVRRAEEYPWSSAAAHALGRKNSLLSCCPEMKAIANWREFLHAEDSEDFLGAVRRANRKGVPVGEDGLLQEVARLTGLALEHLQLRRTGRPCKK